MKHLRTNGFVGVYLEQDNQGEVIGKDLFGNDVIKRRKPQKKESPTISVGTKLTRSEYDKLCALANKFGMSKYQYLHDIILQQMHDHELLLNND